MKIIINRAAPWLAILACFFGPRVSAQLSIPGDGSDGALIISTNTVIDLREAVSGVWDANNNANKGNGIYDTNKWAVVFKYTSVNISTGATVRFVNHLSRAPVVWLVKGDVTINGTIDLDGQTAGYNAPQLAEPGPGGFRGGSGFFAPGVGRSSGLGVGGGIIAPPNNYGAGGSYGTSGEYGPAPYGNPSLLPLIGGSGGGGYNDPRGGGAGAGAILIASTGTLSLDGVIHANGGSSAGGTGSGSGGGIRLVCNSLRGAGALQCLGGTVGYNGGLGRIRIERVLNDNRIQVTPEASIVPLAANSTPWIWLPSDGPSVRIVSIGGLPAPADPRASFGTVGADVTLPQTSTTPVVVETTNAEDASTVALRIAPRSNGNAAWVVMTNRQITATSPLTIRWSAPVPVNDGYSAIQVLLVRP